MSIASIESLPRMAFKALYETVCDIDGINKVAEVFFSTMAVLEASLKKIPAPLTQLCTHFGHLVTLTVFVSIFKRLREIYCTEDGVSFQDYHWSYRWSTYTCFVYNALNLVWLVDILEFVKVNAKCLNCLGHIGTVFVTASYALEMWYDADRINTGCKAINKANRLSGKWKQWSETLTNIQIARIINKWEMSERAGTIDERGRTILIQWQAIQKCQSPAEVKAFCERKAVNWKATASNQKIANNKAWVNIAINVVNIALTILPFILPIPTLAGMIIALAVIGLVTNSLDLSAYFFADIYGPTPIRPIPLPGTPAEFRNLLAQTPA